MNLEARLTDLEKRVAELEKEAQPRKFIPEDSENGKCENDDKCSC